jgi:DNA-binding beta-propeller fold protein YncE
VAFCSSPAFASRGHAFESTFGEPCVAEPCEGRLKEPDGVAVNEATGQVYVVDKGANRVARFSGAGAYEAEFDGSGTLPGEGKVAGSGAGEVETGRFERPEGIAVDNSCALAKISEPACKEGDPSAGDVYVLDGGHLVIDKYTAGGEYVGQISVGGQGRFSEEVGRFSEPLDGVAVDRTGAVWVYREAKVIDSYTNAVANEFSHTVRIAEAGFGAPGIAVDSNDNFYVHVSPSNRIAKADSTGAILSSEVDKEPASAVATDPTNDDVFIDNITMIGAFNAAGVELERLGREQGAEHLSEGAGIAVSASAETLYVADAAAKDVVVFGPVQPSPPTIESQSASEISSEGATLGAELNPRSEAGEEPTEYHFAYGACTAPGGCAESGYEAFVPEPDGQIEPDFEVHPVSVAVLGLKPSTTYHYKVVARNALGTVESTEATFTTQGSGGELVLPDGRGWELVSPPDKQGALIEPIAEAGVVQASADGQAITYLANAPLDSHVQGAANKSQVLSSRSTSSWSSRDISLPHLSATGSPVGQGQEYKFFDPELSLGAVQPFGEFNPLLSEEASEPTAYLHVLSGACDVACFRPLVTGKEGFANVPPGTEFGESKQCEPSSKGASIFCGPEFVGASDDLSHIVLRSKAALKVGAGVAQLYEWSSGVLSQISLLPGPGGESASEPVLGFHKDQLTRRAISTDGTRVDWEAAGDLYSRDVSRQETVQLDNAEPACEAEPGPEKCTSGGGEFQIASADGSRVFFTDTHRLTKDSGAEPEGANVLADLYECRIVVEGGELGCDLTDLTPANGVEGAGVQGQLLGAGEDGERLFFVATGVLGGVNSEGESPVSGQPNLYERHGSSTTFIATLSKADTHDWGEEEGELAGQPTRVSPDGRFVELMSQASLTGYDNRDTQTGRLTAEVYVFDAGTEKLECASCDPTGARPNGVEYHKLEPGSGGLVGGPRGIWPDAALVAANVPGTTAISTGGEQKERYQPRYLLDSGRLFFDTVNALVAQDSNNTQDVYEYELPGVGGEVVGCKTSSEAFSARSGGCVNLISSGKSTQESAFLDASESGDDVFFLTAARLSTIDTDNALDVHDAHVCSDSPCITYKRSEPSNCEGESSCRPQPSPQPSIFGAPPPSMTFSGPGNFAPVPLASPPHKSAEQIRAERLKRSLRACRSKKNKHKRKACEKAARNRYGKPKAKAAKPKSKAKSTANRSRYGAAGRRGA